MFTVYYPYVMLLLPLPLLLRLILPTAETNTMPALPVTFFDRYAKFEREFSQELPSQNKFNQFLLVLIWLFILLAASRPIYLGPPMSHIKAGRNLMLAVDISGSMQIPDMNYDRHRVRRIDLVKHVAREFIEKREGDRLGLILFGTNAFLQSPLTFDRHTVAELLDDATLGLAGGRTAIGDAIGLAIKRLKEVEEKQRILILLTDGASNAGLIAPLQAAKLAKDYGVKIYTIGLGSAQISLADIMGNPFAAQMPSDLDEDTLIKIADLTGGQFFRANNSHDLQEIYTRINQLEPIQHEAELVRLKQDYYYLPLLAALLISFLLMARHIAWLSILPLSFRLRFMQQ